MVSNYKEALIEIIQLYNKAGFKIAEIRSDNKFRPLKEALSINYGIEMNFANPQEHVPEAKRNNQVIKERVRAHYHRLPYKQLTKKMTKVLVMDAAKKLNFSQQDKEYLSTIVQEWFCIRKILTIRNIASIYLGLTFKHMMNQVQKTTIQLEHLIVYICDIQTIIKEVMSYYILQAITSLLKET